MGQYWHRMRVKEGVDLTALRYWISEEASAYRQYENLLGEWLRTRKPETEMQSELALQQYIVASKNVVEMLELELVDSNETAQLSTRRITLITRNDIFPAEWRVEMFRALLPDEVPFYYNRLTSYIDQIHAGGHRGYLLNWYLYTESNNAREFTQELKRAVQGASSRANSWAQRLMQTELPQQIHALMMPSIYSAPSWADWEHHTGIVDHQTDEHYLRLHHTVEQLQHLRHEWNRRVPTNKKMRSKDMPFYTRTFEEYLQQADGYEGYFEWLKKCVSDGVGFFRS